MTIELKALKAVLMLRRLGNTYDTKAKQIADTLSWYRDSNVDGHGLSESDLDDWISAMQVELAKTPEQREQEQAEWREQEAAWEWEQAQQEIASFRRDRDEWTDLWDDRARSCGAI